MADEIRVTPADVSAMFQENPLAMEQAKRFALQRELAQVRAELAKLEAKVKELIPAPAEPPKDA